MIRQTLRYYIEERWETWHAWTGLAARSRLDSARRVVRTHQLERDNRTQYRIVDNYGREYPTIR